MWCRFESNFHLLTIIYATFISTCVSQSDVALPFSFGSFRNYWRSSIPAPRGRVAKLQDVRILFYGNLAKPSMYHFADIERLLTNPEFDLSKPTALYIHGYVEVVNDDSVQTMAKAYQRHGGYNFLLLDWSNLGFGNYISVSLDVKQIGKETGAAVAKLLKGGLSLERLHVIGHSLGAHIGGFCCRHLKSSGFEVPRLTALDPAYPGFYPALLSKPFTKDDARFVDVIHTDGGAFGTPLATGHADFWPNAGHAKQPGCPPVSLLLTLEDLCSHWRSWRFWAEALEGGRFLARKCDGYDQFLRGQCHESPLVEMGNNASSELRGNFYLRTATKSPFALGERGAD